MIMRAIYSILFTSEIRRLPFFLAMLLLHILPLVIGVILGQMITAEINAQAAIALITETPVEDFNYTFTISTRFTVLMSLGVGVLVAARTRNILEGNHLVITSSGAAALLYFLFPLFSFVALGLASLVPSKTTSSDA